MAVRDGTPVLSRHRSNGSSRNAATTATTATHVAGHGARLQKKEAGAAGGESGARAHGPALGGEAGPVLSVSLSAKCPRMRPPVSVSRPPVAYPPQVPVAASAQSNYNICGRLLVGLLADWLPEGSPVLTGVSLGKTTDTSASIAVAPADTVRKQQRKHPSPPWSAFKPPAACYRQ